MFSGLTLVTPPASAPVTVADAKAHSRVEIALDDALFAGYITSATTDCEDRISRAIMPQTWRLALRDFPGRCPGQFDGYAIESYLHWNHIKLPKPPLASITSFTYQDTAGNISTMTQGYGSQMGNYLLDLEPEPGRIVLPFSGVWPTTILLPGSPIKITYVCGYPSWSGTADFGSDGSLTWTGGSKFDPRMVGTWINVNGNSMTVASYTDDQHMQLIAPPQLLQVAPGVAYTANAVPMAIRNAILYLAAHRYENREPIVTGRGITSVEVAGTVDSLLAPYRVYV